MDVLSLGVESELQLLAYATGTAMWDLDHIYNLPYSLRQHWILNPLRRPGIEHAPSWMLCLNQLSHTGNSTSLFLPPSPSLILRLKLSYEVVKPLNNISECFFCLLSFQGHICDICRFPGWGELELQLPATATATATPDLSLICNLHHSSQEHWILNPLSEARDDRTCVLVDASQICFC